MRDAVIVDAVRSPLGKRNGALRDTHAVDLSAHVLQALVARTGVDPSLIEDVIWGCVSQTGEQGGNIARYAALDAGFPDSVAGTTVDRQCGSSQQAAHFAAAAVIAGQCEVVIAGGVESMSRVPMGSSVTQGPGTVLSDQLNSRYAAAGGMVGQGTSSEMIATKWGLTREMVDSIAVDSHARAVAAIEGGAFAGQIAPVPVSTEIRPSGLFDTDEGIRPGTSIETLAGLKPAFAADGVTTAGNSSQISDGAAALLIMTSDKARQLGLTPIARFHTFALAGNDPIIMLTAPILATASALKKSGLRLDEIGAIEINEAFATVVAAWQAETGADMKSVNALGGAIAIGHPLGGSGARLMTTLVHHMRDNGIRYGLQTMCEGGGMANATILELL